MLVSGICWQDQQLVIPEPPDNVAWEAQVTKTIWSDSMGNILFFLSVFFGQYFALNQRTMGFAGKNV